MEDLDNNTKDVPFLLWCVILVILIPLGFLFIMTTIVDDAPSTVKAESEPAGEPSDTGTTNEGETGFIGQVMLPSGEVMAFVLRS